ncbi:hypothetical protein GCM10017674_60570 [Streptomyces gardneri]|uniref:Uncharacterized protein n=1 Tax=Streptomyces gardneri TaxID=66892 RepID=A0A4Y3RHI3_9ACTN|nr:hypothetical protein SGA01_28660 [Streptomyces gardneri]GHH13379.1 hypothetical protein GCM10017674_60570 [Streptomyces gardneri]
MLGRVSAEDLPYLPPTLRGCVDIVGEDVRLALERPSHRHNGAVLRQRFPAGVEIATWSRGSVRVDSFGYWC